MLLFSPRWLFLMPGLVVFLASLFAFIALFIGPVKIGDVVFDVHTLFFLETGVILGYLSMSLGLVIRMFGIREGLLQEHSFLEKLRVSPVLEVGSLVGLFIIASGVFFGFDTLVSWGEAGFGSLEKGELLRQISLSTLQIMLGGITLMISLIMGFLALPSREQRN
jgi:hypothetical protein